MPVSAPTQSSTACVSSTASQAGSLSGQNAGSVNLAFVAWNDSTSIINGAPTSSNGNTYVLVGHLQADSASVYVYAARNIKAGSETVTVSWPGSVSFPEVKLIEIPGADLNTPVDAGTFAITGFASSAIFTTTSGKTGSISELAVAYNYNGGTPTSATPGAGWTPQVDSGTNSSGCGTVSNSLAEYEFAPIAAGQTVKATTVLSPAIYGIQVVVGIAAAPLVGFDHAVRQTFPFTQNGALQVPPDVKTLDADCFGAGGGGAGSGTSQGGCGGGGAIQSRQPLTVTPGTIVSVSIGQPAAAPALSTNGGPGGDTTVQAGATVLGTWSGASGGASGGVGTSGGRSFKATGGGNAYMFDTCRAATRDTDVAAGGYAITSGGGNSAGARNCVGGFNGGAAGATRPRVEAVEAALAPRVQAVPGARTARESPAPWARPLRRTRARAGAGAAAARQQSAVRKAARARPISRTSRSSHARGCPR